MRRIIVDRATIALLDNLSEPLEFCDESGWLLGTFIPEAGELVEVTASAERLYHQEVGADLGEEFNVYGYEMDLE